MGFNLTESNSLGFVCIQLHRPKPITRESNLSKIGTAAAAAALSFTIYHHFIGRTETLSSEAMATKTWVDSILNPKTNWFAAQHMKAVSGRLRKYGLRFEDLYDPKEDLDIKEALNRLPQEVVDARNQRLKRAMDLSMKHQYLSDDLQAQQTPFRSYLKDMLALVKKERAEREALGALPLYQRTIP
ncbi:hypothetical protein M9H77_24536 [Catharanthus roseus]|uniref:Uncharacterized protein n=1 Tax=Catharanthus roseus TaxID=4058 RepID=A0ACC0B0A3_CATRO|nr:hypothetical protein M9H77_24536 [Catharanthus roseus]